MIQDRPLIAVQPKRNGIRPKVLGMRCEEALSHVEKPKLEMNVCAVIPAYNEEATIGKIVQETRKYIHDVLVVDNGSTDRTGEIARKCGAEVVYYGKKKGYGASQRAGQAEAIKRGYNYILQLDGDGQHDPKDIPLLLEAARSGDYDLVLASRFLTESYKEFSSTRQIGIRFFSKSVSLFGHSEITDVTSGFKVYKASSLKRLNKPSDKYPAVQQVLEMLKKGMQIREVPVEMANRRAGKSHLSLARFATYPFIVTWLMLRTMAEK